MANQQFQRLPEDIRALQDASAKHALQALSNALKEGIAVKGYNGGKDLTIPREVSQ